MIFVLAQEVVSHDRAELYAVIAALVGVIAYKERQVVRLTNLFAKAMNGEERREDSE